MDKKYYIEWFYVGHCQITYAFVSLKAKRVGLKSQAQTCTKHFIVHDSTVLDYNFCKAELRWYWT